MKILSILFFLLSAQAWGFPQLSRHGYFNCTACHYSPSGGGLLNAYGRELSAELLSSHSNSGEAKPFYGLFPDSEHFTVAGYLRGLQLLTDNRKTREAKAILMQSDLEAGLTKGWITTIASIGRRQINKEGKSTHQLFSRNHYLLINSPLGINLRAGRFMPAWGLNHPNHSFFVRRNLALGNDTERYTAEASYLGENFSILGSMINGKRNDRYARSHENARSILLQKTIGEANRLGLGFYKGENEQWNRKIINSFGIISWQKDWFSQFEIDYQWKTASKKQVGFVVTHLLSWEVNKGIIPYLSQEWDMLDKNNANNSVTSLGAGLNWYPRPHLEINAQLSREFYKIAANTTIVFLMANLYL